MERERVFICSPYSGDVERNVVIAKKLCLAAIDRGFAPFAPHLLYPQILRDEGLDRAVGIACGLAYLKTCRAVWTYNDLGISAGMITEHINAAGHSIPIETVRL